MGNETDKVLSSPDYWDKHYSKSDGTNPTHEWFRSFDDLGPFFEKNLLGTRPPESTPRILHLGCGDSASPPP
jgi:EEF1A lysine methyltransferase 4